MNLLNIPRNTLYATRIKLNKVPRHSPVDAMCEQYIAIRNINISIIIFNLKTDVDEQKFINNLKDKNIHISQHKVISLKKIFNFVMK